MLCHGRAGTPREDLSGPCGAICDYEVEMEAIRMVIKGIWTRVDEGLKGKPTSFFITDALLFLQAIDGLWEWPWLSATSDLISRHGVKVTIGPTVDLE